MVQLSGLRGQYSGARLLVERFPFSIGRGGADLCLTDRGVWEEHARLIFDAEAGILLRASAEAFTAVNGVRLSEAILRTGDIFELGESKFQFMLAPALRASLRLDEIGAWCLVGAITLAQVFLIYALMRF